jgi:predicted DNA-binding transcriptional regulator AlpA
MVGRAGGQSDGRCGVNKPSRTLAEIAVGPPTLDVPTACQHIGISTSHGYNLIGRGEFPCRVLMVGTRRRVVTASLVALLSAEGAAA